MNTRNHDFKIPMDHPALADHFPGNPLVPGALILDHVLSGCAAFSSRPVLHLMLKEIKFKSPLRGEEKAHAEYSESPQGIRFKVWVTDREIASGIISPQPSMGE